MTRDELVAEFRTITDDTEMPYLWDNSQILSYLAAAEAEAATRAELLIEDTSGTYCKITLVAGTSSYALNPLVLDVLRAQVTGQSTQLDRTTPTQLDMFYLGWITMSGIPVEYYLNGQNIRVVPTPTVAGEIRMVVSRLPVPIDITGPEISERYHRRMLDWAVRCAYLKRGLETYNEQAADMFEKRFIESFGIAYDANVQRKKRDHAPTVTAYGGI